jgi:acyl carrier protein
MTTELHQQDPADLVAWLRAYLAELLDIEAHEVGTDLPLDALGVDSATALVLSADLSVRSGRGIRPAEVLDHPTIEDLARHAAGAPLAGAAAGAVAG